MRGKWRLRQMIGDLYRMGTLHMLYPFLYRIYAGKPVDENKVVFLEVRQPELSDNFRLLFQRLSGKEGSSMSLMPFKVAFLSE